MTEMHPASLVEEFVTPQFDGEQRFIGVERTARDGKHAAPGLSRRRFGAAIPLIAYDHQHGRSTPSTDVVEGLHRNSREPGAEVPLPPFETTQAQDTPEPERRGARTAVTGAVIGRRAVGSTRRGFTRSTI